MAKIYNYLLIRRAKWDESLLIIINIKFELLFEANKIRSGGGEGAKSKRIEVN